MTYLYENLGRGVLQVKLTFIKYHKECITGKTYLHQISQGVYYKKNLSPSKSRKECITSKTYLHQNLVRSVLQV